MSEKNDFFNKINDIFGENSEKIAEKHNQYVRNKSKNPMRLITSIIRDRKVKQLGDYGIRLTGMMTNYLKGENTEKEENTKKLYKLISTGDELLRAFGKACGYFEHEEENNGKLTTYSLDLGLYNYEENFDDEISNLGLKKNGKNPIIDKSSEYCIRKINIPKHRDKYAWLYFFEYYLNELKIKTGKNTA